MKLKVAVVFIALIGLVSACAGTKDGGSSDGGDLQCTGKNDFSPCALPEPHPSPYYKYNICVEEVCVMPGCDVASCNPPGPEFTLPPAGSPGLNYTRNTSVTGQPIVTDNITKLVWQGCAAGLSGNDCAAGTVATKNWADSLAYCNSLDWGGHTDWRLPSAEELQSIVDYSKYNPSIDETNFPKTPTDWFWSSSSHAYDTSGAWAVAFYNGIVGYKHKDSTGYVRCVRAGP